MAIVPFSLEHVPAAAALVADGVARLAATVPALPTTWTEPAVVARVIAGLAERGPGLAVLDDGELQAFHAATLLDGHGGRWSYTPDVGHAAAGPDPARLRERLYAGLAETWIRGAVPEHVITVLADDDVAIGALRSLGFGDHVIDLVRDLSEIEAGPLPDGLTVRRGVAADAKAVLALDLGLRRHLTSSPVFLRVGAAPTLELHRRRLDDPAEATFLAERSGETVSFLRIGPCATDVASIVRDAGTASITAAFTRSDLRGDNVATALLAAAVRWASEAGFVRCAVDHESANREGARFWARHATPVTVSMVRRLPPGTVP
ncbi:MAG: GNAT family N-acetyltransferase [Chloroflexota bacterium]